MRMLAEWSQAEGPAVQVNKGNRPLHILVVDDDIDLLRLYRLQMGSWSPQPKVTTVSNGLEALIKLGLERPDILIIDLKMPGMDGFQVLQVLRDIPAMDAMEIIVVSALSQKEIEKNGGVKSGILVLPKPVPFPALRNAVEKIVEKSRRDGVAPVAA